MNKIINKSYEVLDEKTNLLDETIFHNANGYIGVRGSLSEGVNKNWDTMRGIYINGCYDIIPMRQAENLCNFVNEKESMLNVADTMSIECYIDNKKIDITEGRIIEHTHELNMEEGITIRRLKWESNDGKQISLIEKRITSFELLSLFVIDYEITPLNFDGEIKLVSIHQPLVSNYCNPNDPRVATESLVNLKLNNLEIKDDYSVAVSETKKSHIKICSLVKNSVVSSLINKETNEIIDEEARYTVIINALKQDPIHLIKTCIFNDSRRSIDCKDKSISDLKYFDEKGLDYFYDKQKSYLNKFWENADMEIDGDQKLSQAVLFNMYELLCSSPKDDSCSIAAKGLSGEGYEGHYFWDAETFVLPLFIQTNPDIAKHILGFRYSSLDKARENAKLLGHNNGALYPWRTITGVECSGYYVSGSAAYHINADIAYAIVKYYLTTGDENFIEDKGLEILIETARLWLDVGNYNQNGEFVINMVTGPDEYTCMVNNNYYTNCAAKFNLKWTNKLYRLLEAKGKIKALKDKINVTDDELNQMVKAADKMFLPYDEKLRINPQDDSFLSKPIWDLKNTPKDKFPLLLHYHPLYLYRYQVCKQADTVLSYFMFEDEQDIEVMKNSFLYYEPITTHDSSLSTCIFSIVASRLGFKDKAYSYFGDSAKLDIENRHNNTHYGIHTANMGGSYMAIVNGFAGLRIDENGLRIEPNIPDKWNELRFKIHYQNRLIQFRITNNQTKVELLNGDDISINIYKEKYLLKEKKEVIYNG